MMKNQLKLKNCLAAIASMSPAITAAIAFSLSVNIYAPLGYLF